MSMWAFEALGKLTLFSAQVSGILVLWDLQEDGLGMEARLDIESRLGGRLQQSDAMECL